MKDIIIATIGSLAVIIPPIVTIIANKQNVKKKDLDEKIDKVQLDNCKNFLVQEISAAERRQLTQAEKERYYEIYDLYIDLGGNSYIHSETERLKKEGKI